MNWKSPLLLVVLAAGAGAWLWKGDEWLPATARKAAPPDPPELAKLEADFDPKAVTKVEIRPADGDAFSFTRTAAGWTQSGDWPLLAVAVDELVDALGALRTRFQPIPLAEDADLSQYGLTDAQKPLAVVVSLGDKMYPLKFGEGPLKPGETPFTRPAFVRVGEAKEVLNVGPDVLPVLRRRADAYRRRQLFPDTERVKLAGTPTPPVQPGAPPEPPAPVPLVLPGEAVREIRVTAKSPKFWGLTPWPVDRSFTLKRYAPTPAPTVTEAGAEATLQPERLADAWRLDAPVYDRADPAALQKVLAAVPDLRAERFVPSAEVSFAADHPFAVAQLLPIPLEPFPAALVRLYPDNAVLSPLHAKFPPAVRARIDTTQIVVSRTKTVNTYDGAELAVAVTGADGKTVAVKFGGLTGTVREESGVANGGVQPPPRLVTSNYRYAQVEGNPQVFTVPAEKVAALPATAGDLAETRVARFSADEVRQVRIAQPGKPPIVLNFEKGEKNAPKPDKRDDRWYIDRAPNPLLADTARVSEFVGRLAGFTGDPTTDLYLTDPKARGLDPAKCVAVTVVVRERRPEGAPAAPAREYKLLVGAPDFAAGKLPVQLAGWPRITLVPDRAGVAEASWLGPLFAERLHPVFARDAIAYRNRKLFDSPELTGVTVTGEGGFALKQEKAGDDKTVWKLTAPLASDADPAGASGLVGQLATLQATEFVSESGAAAEFGLDRPKFAATLTFANGRTYKLEVGAARPGKAEVFARLDGGAVFGLPTATTDGLAAGALKLLPLEVWKVQLERLTAVEVRHAGATFVLAKDGTNWKLTAPFQAPVSFLDAQPTVAALATLPAARYEALSAADLARYGLDKPFAQVKLSFTEKSSDGDRAVTKTVLVGGLAGGGPDRFAKLDGAAPVFVLPATYLIAAETKPLSLLDRNLLSLDAARIAKVQIAGDKPEQAVALSKDAKGVWKAEGAAFTVDPLVVGQVVNTFAPLPVERLEAFGDAVKWADFGLEKPESTVTVTLSGEKPVQHTVQLGKPALGGGRYVRVDGGKAVGVLRPDAVLALARTKLDFADRTLLSFKPEELTLITRTRGKDELEIAPGNGDSWDVTKPAKQKADKLLVEELADTLGRLRADKVAAFGKRADAFKQYGLEPPEAVLTLTVGDRPRTLLFGKPVDAAKPDGDRYVAVAGTEPDAAVGVLPAALANRLLAPPVSFRDRAMAKFVDADKLELVRGPRKATFAKVNGTWKMTAPFASDAEQAALDDLVGELARLRASDWVAEKPTPADLKAFGLENPEATWTVSNGDKVELALKLGKLTADGRVHALAGAGGMVALLSKTDTAKVLGEYRARKPWTLDAFQAEGIEVVRGDKRFTFQKLGTAWLDPLAPNDVIDPKAVTELLGALTALQVERYAVDADGDPKLFGLDKPEVKLTVLLKDGKRELEVGGVVGGTGGKQRYARVVEKGRSDVFVLSAADTERVTRDRGVYVQKK